LQKKNTKTSNEVMKQNRNIPVPAKVTILQQRLSTAVNLNC